MRNNGLAFFPRLSQIQIRLPVNKRGIALTITILRSHPDDNGCELKGVVTDCRLIVCSLIMKGSLFPFDLFFDKNISWTVKS